MADQSAYDVLGENTAKLLSDKLYERRKQASVDIEMLVKEAAGDLQGHDKVEQILGCLKRDFIDSPLANTRKGGLIGFASVAFGLDEEVGPFLPKLVLPILDLFKDEDARVRYYASEGLYNISKVVGDGMLAHFNEVFDGICKLYADVDQDVKNAAHHLDRMLKDIVTQSPSKFSTARFVPLLAQLMKHRNPYIRQLLLAWIQLLLKVPEVDMVRYLSQYLDGLFNMLGDQSRDIRQNADACLSALKHCVAASPHRRALQVISEAAPIVVQSCCASDACSRLTALCWLHEFVHLQMQKTQRIAGGSGEVWVNILPDLLRGTLHCIDDSEDEIARMAVDLNNGLLEMVQTMENEIPVDRLVDDLLRSMHNKDSMERDVRTACLQWICMLLTQRQAQMLRPETLDRLFTPIFDTLLHPHDEVVAAALTVLAQVMEGRSPARNEIQSGSTDDLFTVVTHRLLRLFAGNRHMLETRGRLMIRQLCGHLSPRRLYVTVARAIHQESDIQFAQQLVQTFSWILLTATETKDIREELVCTPPIRDFGIGEPGGTSTSETAEATTSDDSSHLFLVLLEPWFHNPVSALALCLWAQQFELASELAARLASHEPTLDLLVQLDQLVHLLESATFARLRLRLLEPRRHPALLKTFLSLAMLLPQAGAFSLLRERLHVVQSGLLLEAQREDLHTTDGMTPSGKTSMGWWASRDKSQSASAGADTDLDSLMERFDAVYAASQGCD